ncbi:unnamed protein product [Cuscuta campestris]|uniref:Uncharacterized protein n=1 Tax=Cuscuta campestris TaxID=132261 RepID=A0A484LQ75_9ASTE|nr:unnamed protein product [Cuscuta campestris]
MAGCTDAEECLLFFSSLRGRPVEWFNGLPHGRIGSFEKLAKVFCKKYQDNCIKRKKFTYLNTVGQREKESLTQFLTRWRDEVDKVEEMDDKTAMSLLMNAFRSGDLYTEFCRRPPSSYQETYNTAWEYAEAEVLNKSKRELEEGYTKAKSDKPKKDDQTGGSKPKATYDGSIHQIRDDKKGEQPKRPWTEKWCTYHQSDSHNTADCRNVKAVLKEMALNGELGEELKTYLTSDIVLSKPETKETLYLYLGVTQMAVSSVLMRDDGVQRPIYYVSKALNGAESRYTPTEKAGYALFITAKKLTSYFQAHPIVVLTDLPLGTVMRDSTSSGRMIKWAMMLTQFNIEYRRRTAIKGQAVADFLVEMTGVQEEEPARAITEPWWSMSVDGASGPKGYGGGVVFTTPEGFKVYHALIFNFKLTNNEAEYEALIGGLRLAKTLQITCLQIKSDSGLVVGHINGNMEAKGEKMQKYRDLLSKLNDLTEYVMEQIPRGENTDADLLSKLTQAAPEHVSKLARIETLEKASIEGFSVSMIEEDGQHNPDRVEPDDIWMDDLVRYYITGQFPEDEDMIRKVKLRAPRFQMLDGRLYKRAFGGPLLRCLTRAEAERVIAEVHEGVCAAHQMSRTLAQRIILLGYFWPTMNQDCERYVQRCKTCQVFYKFPGRPATYYHPVSNVIPFARFGMDIIRAFPQDQGRKKYVMVAIDYFTKWVEAEAYATITTKQCQRFVWKYIITRFGSPQNIVTDNRPQFRNPGFTKYLEDFGTAHNKASVAYPQGNGHVENANRTIVDGIKKRLGEAGTNWLEELPHIIWAYRVTSRRATGETPFVLTYGCEARLPIEAKIMTFREKIYEEKGNEEDHLAELNLLEERRMVAEAKMIEY